MEWLSLLALGFVNGASICSLSCLHYLGPTLISGGSTFKQGAVDTSYFLMGKLFAYSVLGAVAGLFGKLVEKLSLTYGTELMAFTLVILAVYIPFQKAGSCKKKKGGLFGLGLGSSFIPCPALGVMVAIAVASQSLVVGASFGFAYGFGLMFSPMLITGGLASLFGGRLQEVRKDFIPWVKGFSSLVVLLLAMKLIALEN